VSRRGSSDVRRQDQRNEAQAELPDFKDSRHPSELDPEQHFLNSSGYSQAEMRRASSARGRRQNIPAYHLPVSYPHLFRTAEGTWT
jgi:hypothetical protein